MNIQKVLKTVSLCCSKDVSRTALTEISIHKITETGVVVVATSGHFLVSVKLPVIGHPDWNDAGYSGDDIVEGSVFVPKKRFVIETRERGYYPDIAKVLPQQDSFTHFRDLPVIGFAGAKIVYDVFKGLGCNDSDRGLYPDTWGTKIQGMFFDLSHRTCVDGFLLVMPVRYNQAGGGSVRVSRYNLETGMVEFVEMSAEEFGAMSANAK